MNQLVDDRGRPTWMNGPDDPFVDLLIDPGNVDEAQEYARRFYQAARASARKAALGVIFALTVTGLLWFLPLGINGSHNRVAICLGSAFAAFLLIEHIVKTTRARARDRRKAVSWQPWARSSRPLSAYLVTTSDPHRLWEAAGHEAMREVLQKAIVNLHQYGAADHLTPARAEELNGYLERDDELRARIVELCDPPATEVR